MTADEIKVLEKIFDTKLDPLGKQLDRVEKRVEKVEDRLTHVEKKLTEFKEEMLEFKADMTEFRATTESTLLVITERLNQTADKEDVQALEQRVAVLEHHHNN